MTETTRPRKTCPYCGSTNVRRYIYKDGGHRCESCGRAGFTPIIKNVVHGATGLATGKRVIV